VTSTEPMPRDDDQLQPGQHGAAAPAWITTTASDRQPDDVDRSSKRVALPRPQDREPPPPRPKSASMAPNLLLTAAVSLVCGVLGAMSYFHFYGYKPAGSTPAHASVKSSPGEKSSTDDPPANAAPKDSSTQAPSPSSPAASSTAEMAELKDQMRILSQRMDRLGERVDRLQTLLSLAVPLLQRLAPKN
jgi:hypothetical protein